VSLWSKVRAAWNYLVPSDEALEARPENDAEIRRRMNELESLRAIARERVAQLHSTTSPLRRKAL
jgi:histidinol-phosphate/aromatic aminotransferase/cobyric acid decarboxylase-like protein